MSNRELSGRERSKTGSSRSEIVSGQNSGSLPEPNSANSAINSSGVNRSCRSQLGLVMIRTTRFSVNGQLAHSACARVSHQRWVEGNIGAAVVGGDHVERVLVPAFLSLSSVSRGVALGTTGGLARRIGRGYGGRMNPTSGMAGPHPSPLTSGTSVRFWQCILRAVWLGLGIVVGGRALQAARPWPDSTARIVVFADQLPGDLTAAQRTFAATHLAGTQKMLRSEIRALRAENPDFLCLHYQLGVGAGAHSLVVGDEWVSDWSEVNSHEDWFLHNPAGQRVHQTGWDWDLMDVTYTDGTANTGFPAYWISACWARMAANEDDGVFADSYTQDGYSFGQCAPTHPWLESVEMCQENWIPHLETFGRAVRAALEADGRGYLFLPNLGGLVTGWDPMDYGVGHGGMIEGFGFWGPGSYFDRADWELQMERALGLVRREKVLICQAYPGVGNGQERLLSTASYLLIKGSRTYLNLLSTDAVALEYYPEYTIELGSAVAGVAGSIGDLWHEGWGVYRRDYAEGIVLVNPGDTPVSIPSLGGTYRRVVPEGGGAVDGAGSYHGRLTYPSVKSLVIPAHAGEVLLRAGPTTFACALFPADNIWNQPVDALPVHVSSAAYINSIGASATVHPDFGAGLWEGQPIGIPFVTVPGDQPRVGVVFEYADESDPGPYPIPADVPIEGGAESDGDRHVLVLDRDRCVLYELYDAERQGDGSWRAGSGAVFDLGSNVLRPRDWTSADAAGLPILPGLVRYEEVEAGEIRHALRFTAPRTQRALTWPARHQASSDTDPALPPMGQRFRLKAGVDLSGFSAPVQVILRALQRYGLILADNGSAWFLSGVPDERWDNDTLVTELRRLHGSDFEAVEVSSLMIDPDSGAALKPPVAVTGLAAMHRSGQTFLTWNELSAEQGERYRVYRHVEPITADNLAAAVLLYEVPEGTANFYANRYNDPSGTWRARYLDRLVIVDGGRPLLGGTGLLVWTLATSDFGGATSGRGYYAVTVVGTNGVEQRTLLNPGSVTAAIEEAVADPLPVETAVDVGARGHLYIQYMDLRRWNPTFHAPHERNAYYGLNAEDPAVGNALQYAYDYVVYEPECSEAPAPVYFNLHGWGGNTYEPFAEDPEAYGWCAYRLFPVDMGETWYFGFARDCDYRRGEVPEAGDTVMNYTEQRLLRMVYDLVRHPPGVSADPDRVYAWGHSMGGSGVLSLSLRYPNVFATMYASAPMTDYRHSGDGGGTDWRSDLDWKWGSVDLNLPVGFLAPGGWAGPLTRYEGAGVWDWQDHLSNLSARSADEMVPLGVAHGTADTVIEWNTQGQPLYAGLDRARRCYGGAVTADDHTWLSFAGLPPSLDLRDWAPFQAFGVRRNETVPALANASGNAPLPPLGPGGYNLTVEWSASWNPWDGAPWDTTNVWQMSLRTTGDVFQTVDLTPRRLQRFLSRPGQRAAWRNTAVVGGGLVQEGTVTADTNGLFLIPGVLVSPEGNRVRIELSTEDPPAGRTWYVAPDGDDADGGTLAEPWCSPGVASRRLRAGDTLILRGGRYVQSVFDGDILTPPSGQPDAWITIRGEEGNRPVLAGRDNLFASIILGGCSNVRVENLEITHDTNASGTEAFFRTGISVTGEPASSNIVLNALYVHHLDEGGLDAQDVDGLIVTNCLFEYCGFGAIGGPAGLHGGLRHVSIRNSRLAYSGHYYQGTDGAARPYDRPDGFGIEPSAGPVEIVDTVAEHNYGDGLDSKAANTTIRRCVVANNSCDGVKLWDGGSRVENTVVYGRGDGDSTPTPWAPIVLGNAAPTNRRFEFVNVTVHDTLGGGYLLYAQYDHPTVPLEIVLRNGVFQGMDSSIWINSASSLTADHNLFYLPGRPGSVVIHGEAVYASDVLATLGAGNRYGDPRFVAPAWGTTGDYHLRAESPALGLGTAEGAPADDLEGRLRGVPPDAGAYEAVATPAFRGAECGPTTEGFRLVFTVGPGALYVVEGSADLQDWDELAAGTAAEGTVVVVDTTFAGTGRRFYRVRVGGP